MVKKIADPKDVTVEYKEPKVEKKTPVRGSVRTNKSWVSQLKKDVAVELEKERVRSRTERNKAIYKVLHDVGISDEEIKQIKGP